MCCAGLSGTYLPGSVRCGAVVWVRLVPLGLLTSAGLSDLWAQHVCHERSTVSPIHIIPSPPRSLVPLSLLSLSSTIPRSCISPLSTSTIPRSCISPLLHDPSFLYLSSQCVHDPSFLYLSSQYIHDPSFLYLSTIPRSSISPLSASTIPRSSSTSAAPSESESE